MSPRGESRNKQMREDALYKIRKAALEAFASYGYHGVTMQKIMQISKLSKGLVYHYYPSKEKIFLELVESALTLSREAWEEAANFQGSPWEKIQRITDNMFHISFTQENLHYSMIMLQSMTQNIGIPGLDKLLKEQGSHYDLLIPLIQDAQKEGEVKIEDPEILCNSYYALFQGYIIQYFHNRKLMEKLSPEIFLSIFKEEELG